ncbi:RPB5 subunit of DNA-directed RNA polymerase [Exidia glandulosa HHB12029]|uniref:DNA-directed RNA polymerases I, II, and III subunit RPABC1 n=1 Tax=Exidia glandulosa HHB12029 TaxID=1314781 RepID=A0A165BAI5_EXIGL|nr:RPB5 subunit of DNA-directed RNA polymerase [Exidia glandulosa HHB12029]
MSDEETIRLWKVSKTVHEMVRDRGYQVAEDEINMTLEDFRRQHCTNAGSVNRSTITFFTQGVKDQTDQLFVFFCEDKNVSIKTMRKFLDVLQTKNIQRGIIVFSGTMTPSARKVITGMSQDYKLEEFAEADLIVNITHHILVPKHEVMTPDAKKALLERYRLKETQLPRIQLADPVARYYGLKRGQVVKITRPSETSGRYASYRICF